MAPAKQACGMPLKWVCLTLMVAQTVSMVILLRISRTQHVEGLRYLSSAAIFLAEVLKFVASGAMHWHTSTDFRTFSSELVAAFHPAELLLTTVPSLLYTVQNNLLFVGISHLAAGTYQVTCQFKILTTAFLSVLILGTKLSYQKWAALFILTAGVSLVALSAARTPEMSAHASTGMAGHGLALGLGAVLGACVLSGLAGVYLERMLKQAKSSLWVCNAQLALSGSIFALVVALRCDGEAIRHFGLLQGFNASAWAVVVCQALGGLLVAAVMKFADNILKCFGCAVAIVLTCAVSAVALKEIQLDTSFSVGVCLVLTATSLYNLEFATAAEERPLLLGVKETKFHEPKKSPDINV